jgi:hypothetical protein
VEAIEEGSFFEDTLQENPRFPRGVHLVCFLTFLCAILMSNADPSISMQAIQFSKARHRSRSILE